MILRTLKKIRKKWIKRKKNGRFED